MKRDLLNRSLLHQPGVQPTQPTQQVAQEKECAGGICMIPKCMKCGKTAAFELILRDRNGAVNMTAHFCSKACVGREFFKYQIPKTY